MQKSDRMVRSAQSTQNTSTVCIYFEVTHALCFDVCSEASHVHKIFHYIVHIYFYCPGGKTTNRLVDFDLSRLELIFMINSVERPKLVWLAVLRFFDICFCSKLRSNVTTIGIRCLPFLSKVKWLIGEEYLHTGFFPTANTSEILLWLINGWETLRRNRYEMKHEDEVREKNNKDTNECGYCFICGEHFSLVLFLIYLFSVCLWLSHRLRFTFAHWPRGGRGWSNRSKWIFSFNGSDTRWRKQVILHILFRFQDYHQQTDYCLTSIFSYWFVIFACLIVQPDAQSMSMNLWMAIIWRKKTIKCAANMRCIGLTYERLINAASSAKTYMDSWAASISSPSFDSHIFFVDPQITTTPASFRSDDSRHPTKQTMYVGRCN